MPAKDDPADCRAGRRVTRAEIEPARWRGAVAGCRAGRYSVSTLLISAIIGGNLVFLLMLYLGARRLGMLFDSGLSDFSMDNGRIFVCGDIHGCIEPLLASLDAVGFDKERDHLYALGNLVDWGPASPAVLALLDEPWFSSTLGYHEMLLLDAATGNYHQHARNGGVWFAWRSPEERAACVAKVKALPVAITVDHAERPQRRSGARGCRRRRLDAFLQPTRGARDPGVRAHGGRAREDRETRWNVQADPQYRSCLCRAHSGRRASECRQHVLDTNRMPVDRTDPDRRTRVTDHGSPEGIR